MGIVERANRTIRERININIFNNDTNKFIEDLRKIEDSYNNSYHRNLEKAPNDLNDTEMQLNIQDDKKFNKEVRKKFYDFKIGDKVRYKINYGKFEKKSRK